MSLFNLALSVGTSVCERQSNQETFFYSIASHHLERNRLFRHGVQVAKAHSPTPTGTETVRNDRTESFPMLLCFCFILHPFDKMLSQFRVYAPFAGAKIMVFRPYRSKESSISLSLKIGSGKPIFSDLLGLSQSTERVLQVPRSKSSLLSDK